MKVALFVILKNLLSAYLLTSLLPGMPRKCPKAGQKGIFASPFSVTLRALRLGSRAATERGECHVILC